MYTGKLVRYLSDRGFGFIAIGHGADSDRAFFVHISEFLKIGIDFPSIGDAFEFEVAEREDGKLRATNLRPMPASATDE